MLVTDENLNNQDYTVEERNSAFLVFESHLGDLSGEKTEGNEPSIRICRVEVGVSDIDGINKLSFTSVRSEKSE